VIVEVLGPAGRPDVETEAVIASHEIRTVFPEETIAQARAAAVDFERAGAGPWSDRLDLTREFIFTIDPPDAKDFDDAISIAHDEATDEWTLGVHIADVAHFVDREAFALWRLGEVQAVLEMMEHADSFEDWPWPFLYREASERFPDARFVLTTRRDEATWLESLALHVERHGRTSFNYRRYIYGVDDPRAEPQRFLEVYRAHNAAVRAYFAERPGRLLEIRWEDGLGWEPLCRFLGQPVPDVPLPHLNRRRTPG